jgi:hypothetical protein
MGIKTNKDIMRGRWYKLLMESIAEDNLILMPLDFEWLTKERRQRRAV